MKHLSAVLALFILISACATVPPVEDTPDVPSEVVPERLPLDDALRNIGICSPRSLREALEILKVPGAGESDYGMELRYLAAAFSVILYPETSANMPAVPAPPGSLYPGLFEAIKKGTFPVVPQEEVSFLTLIIPPMSCLFSSDPFVLEQCGEVLVQAETLETRSVLPPYLLGVVREKQKRWEEARDYFADALEREGSCYPADIGWARVAMNTGQEDEALERLALLSKAFPVQPAIMYLRSQGHFFQGDLDTALALITDALRIRVEHPPYLLLRVKILEAQGNIEQARRILLIVEKKMPENEDIVFLKAKILFRQGSFDNAAILLEEAMRRYSGSDRLAGLYGEVLIAAGRYEEAHRYLEERLEKDPEHVLSLEMLVREAMNRDDLEKAALFMERLLAQDSGDGTIRKAVELYSRLEDWEKVLVYTRELTGKYPDDSGITLLYIESLLMTGKLETAESECRKALLQETDSGTRSTLYLILSRILTDTSARLDMLRSSLFENLHNIDALTALADLYTDLADYRKAFRYINQAYMLDPENPEIRSRYRKIEELAK